MSQPTRAQSRVAPLPPKEEKLWSYVAYLAAIAVGFLAPLGVYLFFKERSAFLRSHAANALNIQIVAALAGIALSVLWFFALLITFWHSGDDRPWPVLVVLFLFALWGATLVGTMGFGAWKVSKGEYWVAPYLPQMVK